MLQLFDVGLASPLKTKFTRHFVKKLHDKTYYVRGNDRATIRKIAIDSFIEAWDETCNKSNCMCSAATVGLEPVDSHAPRRNPYARDLTAEEQAIFDARQRRKANMLDINNCEITENAKAREIWDYINRNDRDRDLCKQITNVHEAWVFLRDNAKDHGVYALSRPPPCRGYLFL